MTKRTATAPGQKPAPVQPQNEANPANTTPPAPLASPVPMSSVFHPYVAGAPQQEGLLIAPPVPVADKLGLRLDDSGNLDLPSLAYVLVSSRLFPDLATVSQAIVKVMVGREIGVGPMQSVINIHVIRDEKKNRTSIMVGAHTIAAKIKSSGRYDYEILRLDSEACELQPYNIEIAYDSGRPVRKRVKIPHIVRFTIDQAKAAGYGGWGWNGQKAFKEFGNWAKDPESMLFARAMSRMEKQHFPDLTGMPVYTPDELGFRVDDAGEAMVVKGRLVPDEIPPEEVGARIEQEGTPTGEQAPVVRSAASPAKVAKLKAVAKSNGWQEANFYDMVMHENGYTDAARAGDLCRTMGFQSLQGMIADESFDTLLKIVGLEFEVYLDLRNNPVETETSVLPATGFTGFSDVPATPLSNIPITDLFSGGKK